VRLGRRVRRASVSLGLGAASTVVLAGCSGMLVSSPKELPSWSPGPLIPAGMAQGVLRYDGECVRLEVEEGPSYVVIWPEDTRLREDLVPPMVVDGRDRVIGSLGDRVAIPGVASPAGSWQEQRVRLIEDVPKACRDQALWFGVPLMP
jgi:hypothetical protein